MHKSTYFLTGFIVMALMIISQPVSAETDLRYANPSIADNLEDMYGNMFVDWDDDGELDMISMHFYHNTYSLYKNTGTDPNGYPYYEIQNDDLTFLKNLVDIDAVTRPDGLFDIIARMNDELRIYRNSGTAGNPVFANYDVIGTLSVPIGEALSYFTYSDLDGDGTKDAVAVAVFGSSPLPGEGELLIPPYHENMGLGLGYDNQGNWLGKELSTHLYVFSNSGTDTNPVFDSGNILMLTDNSEITHRTTTAIAVGDVDGDGKPDLVVAHDNDRLHFYQQAGLSSGIPYFQAGTNLIEANHYNGHIEHAHRAIHLRWTDIDNDGKLELLLSSTGSGRLVICELNGGNKIESEYSVLTRNAKLSTDSLPVPDFGDLNGDGKLDFISGDSSGYINYFENIGTAENPGFAAKVLLEAGGQRIQHIAGPSGSVQGYKEWRWGYTQPMLFDWDLDGDLDIVTSDISGYHTLYLNIGTPTNYSFAAGVRLLYNGGELRTHTRSKPAAIQVDGVNYYFALDEYGYLARYEQDTASGTNRLNNKTWLRYDDSPHMPIRMDGDAGNEGRVKLEPVDWNQDGVFDLLATGTGKFPLSWYQDGYNKNAHITLFVNTGTNANPQFSSTLYVVTHDDELVHPTGNHTAASTMGDINNDGMLDLLMAEETGSFVLYAQSELDVRPLFPGMEQILFDNELTLRWELIRGNNPSLFDQISGGIHPSMYEVTSNLQLPTSGVRGATISWSSSDQTLITSGGEVSASRSGFVTLTATISYGGGTVQVKFPCYVNNRGDKWRSVWKMDDSGNTVADISGFAHGINYGAESGLVGAVNTAYDFKESEHDYIDLGSAIQPGLTNDLTIAAWINPETFRGSFEAMSRNGIMGDSDGILTFALQNEGRLAFSWEYARQHAGKTPLAYWTLDETTGTTAGDMIGNNHCTNHGATIDQDGWSNRAYDFEESAKNYLNCGSGLSINGSTATIAAWIKPESFRTGTGANSRNVIFTDSNNSIIFTLQDSGKLTLLLYNGINYKTFQSTIAVPLNEWSHVAASMDGTRATLYVNGVSVASAAWARDFAGLGDISIGGAKANRNFDGLIDDIRLYGRGINGVEVNNLALYGIEGDTISSIEVDAADAVSLGEWTHVAVTKQDGTTKLFINGVVKKVRTDDFESAFRRLGNLNIGRVNGNKARGFDGLIDETAIYNYALSDNEIALMANKGLMAHWTLDEASGSIVADAMQSYPGTNNGATLQVPGKVGTAYDFEESEGDYVNFGDGLQLSAGNTATVAAWIKPESFRSGSGSSSRNGILGDSTADFSFMLQDQGRLVFQWDSGSAAYQTLQADAGHSLSTGEWAHVAVTRDGASMRLYINGELVKQASNGWAANFVAYGDMILGRQLNLAARGFDGLIDDVRVYNRPLSDNEIALLAAGT
ncbi:LamG-like jellyroll fold domain-containing protein [Paenibacillus sp. PAMC21692]|uniref:LamG-like jellyroll fold domain-containing protein n=1 Tax=Paenibacillus sp. PAMC21692 TaxID=2762320 RepID=UPI00164ED5EE|nr:LamG-like jellyroll fold domain-containing protein [Paenibacillus sp. PAMC21692]QNK59155.1 VCBS repeat-containing protein [Paenibacillus sp. PAMC21692]